MEYEPPSASSDPSAAGSCRKAHEKSTVTPVTSVTVMENPYKRKKLAPALTSSSSSNSKLPPSGAAAAHLASSWAEAAHSAATVGGNFVGGAEAARLAARKKRRGTPIVSPDERQRLEEFIPFKVNPFERFFAAILRSSPEDLVQSDGSPQKAEALWEEMCQRLRLTRPTERLRPVYENQRMHFELRAALVVEEARHAVSQPLAQTWKKGGAPASIRTADSSCTMILMARLGKDQNRGQYSARHTRVDFRKQSGFNRDELFHIRPGSVFQCWLRDGPRSLAQLFLGVVTTSSRDQVETKGYFTVLFFRDLPLTAESEAEWVVTPVCTLINEYRCFEAMTNNPTAVAFLPRLLGQKGPDHIIFIDCDEDDDQVEEGKKASVASPPEAAPKPSNDALISYGVADQGKFRLPRLNPTQQKAARAFLTSQKNSITIVQGPPGTGKTTLLVSTIAQYLLESGEENRRRLMVCAPTNKAISVLASRFLDSVQEDDYCCSALLVGDGDKLLVDEGSNKRSAEKGSDSSKIRTIFLFSWTTVLMDDYKIILNHFLPGKERSNPADLHALARRLERRLTKSLPQFERLIQLAGKITAALQSLVSGGAAHAIVETTKQMLSSLKDLPNDLVWRGLLATAEVIFCTLASAGGAVFRQAPPIHDLIVDEAAAATEPELCIPFHLKPSRLMVVGDPLQLPATVLSRKAIELGLDKSLHERLMYDCNFDHIMLDVQYRMNPQISAFPSVRFYQAKIENGENVVHPNYKGKVYLLDGRPYTFLQVNGMEEQGFGGSYKNEVEARTIVELVRQLHEAAQTVGSSAWYRADKIRVITFYQAQVGLIKRLLNQCGLGNKIVVATVDSSQGCEADIVLVSFVRSRPDRETQLSRHAAGFLTDDRRMNVALTRARYQLICVGNVQCLSRMEGAETIQKLALDAQTRQVVQPYPLQQRDMASTRQQQFAGKKPHSYHYK